MSPTRFGPEKGHLTIIFIKREVKVRKGLFSVVAGSTINNHNIFFAFHPQSEETELAVKQIQYLILKRRHQRHGVINFHKCIVLTLYLRSDLLNFALDAPILPFVDSFLLV